jgi:SAM-dependent methyltransferase
MRLDIREAAARYYDSSPELPDDIPFYRGLIPSPRASILELGCGTGRVTAALADSCGYIQGIDASPAMLSVAREKLRAAGIPDSRAQIEEGDITSFNLGRTFDLIIAPFRVMQNLDSDAEVDGMFRAIHAHLAPRGTCILNVFKPSGDPDTLRANWVTGKDKFRWDVPVQGGRLEQWDRRASMDRERLVLYPELIYRRYEGETLAEEAVLRIAMRCYYPDTFEEVIVKRGFEVMQRWGGYAGEAYGEGSELVIQFREAG